MPCGWEGNRRSGIALAVCHIVTDFSGLSTYGLGLDREMSTPPTLLMGHMYLYVCMLQVCGVEQV